MKKTNVKAIISLLVLGLLVFSACNIQKEIDKSGTEPVITGEERNEAIKNVATNFFNQNRELVNQSDLVIGVTTNFFNLNANSTEFKNKLPLSLKPVYAYGIEGVAYYEVWLTEDKQNPNGWILISATDKDFPIVTFSHNGIPYSKSLTDVAAGRGIASNKQNKIYRFGVSYYTLENQAGQRLTDYGKMPTWIGTDLKIQDSGRGDSARSLQQNENSLEPIEGIHYKLIDNYESLKALYAENYYTARRQDTANTLNRAMKNFTPQAATRDQYMYRWVSGPQCLYTQIPAYTSANNTECWSGCNNNAWTSLFGWWDLNMGKSALIPTTSTGETCPIYRNTVERMNAVDPVQMYFRSVCNTYCSGGGGWTRWSDAWRAYQYTSYRGYGYSYWYQWNNSAGGSVNLADILTDCIANNYRPAHVGANSHFYVAYGWAQWDTNTKWTWAYCYPGWREDHNDDVWISWYDINSSTRVFVY